MSNHSFNTVTVADGTEIELYIAIPEKEGPHPAIIVLQEAFGVNHHIRNVAERLYRAGYAVVAPDLCHRTGRLLDTPYTDLPAVMQHYNALTTEGLTADLKAAFDWLQQHPAVAKNNIGSIGFCLGGRVSFLANATLPLAAAVSYYGGGLEQLTSIAPNLHAPHLFYWGGLDKHITADKRNTIIQAVEAAGKDYTSVVISYADHAFNCDERSSYHPQAAKEAWAHTLAFLENHLR